MHVRNLHDITMSDVTEVGGKAASLGELLGANHRVPPGFVVMASANGRLTPELAKQVLQLFDKLKLDRVAVRSSGVSEDSKDQSWAGQFATFLHVERDELLDAIKACWQSANTERVAAYGTTGKLAVLVQQMVDGDVSGVAFSANPVTGNKTEIMVEAIYGLCEPLVQGTATPDNYVLDKQTGKLLANDIAQKTHMLTYANKATEEVAVAPDKQDQPALSPAQLKELSKIVGSVENYYGFPVDIEWSYQDGALYLLQARPITTV